MLLRAAAIRALRTFIQAVIGFGATSLGAAALGDADAQKALLAALVGAVATAVISFLTGVLAGLPEVGGEGDDWALPGGDDSVTRGEG